VEFQNALQTKAALDHIPNHFRTDPLVLRSRIPSAFNNGWNCLRVKVGVIHGCSVDSPPWIEAPENINPRSVAEAMQALENAYAAAIKSQMDKMKNTGITAESADKLSKRANALGLDGLAEQLQQLPTIEQPVAPSRGEQHRGTPHRRPGKPELSI
jgi:hypothetical protein